MKKFTINTKFGLKEVEAVPFRFKSPAWLKRFQFITHATDGNPLYFTLSDIKTGRSIASLCSTRAEAKKNGRERLIVAGRAKFIEARTLNAL